MTSVPRLRFDRLDASSVDHYSRGTLVIDPTSAVKVGKSIVRSLEPELASKLSAETRCVTEAHLGYGCEALLVEDREGPMVALYRVKWLKKMVPAARFVAGDPARLVMSSSQLIRVLLQRGLPLALVDAPLDYGPPRGIRLLADRELRYASGNSVPTPEICVKPKLHCSAHEQEHHLNSQHYCIESRAGR